MQAHPTAVSNSFTKGRFVNLKSGSLVLLLDVSGSMQTSIDTLRSYLTQLQSVLEINGITNLHLVKFSDWDRSSHVPQTPYASVMSSVVSGLPTDIISVLSATKASEYGSGGTAPEAHCTALALVLREVAGQGDAGINCIIISDAPPHDATSTEPDAITERYQMSSRGLPEHYDAAIELAAQRGVRVSTIRIGGNQPPIRATSGDISVRIDSVDMLATAISVCVAHFLGIEAIPTLPRLRLKLDGRVCRKTLSSVVVTPEQRESYFNQVMNCFTSYPDLLPSMMSISVGFFQCLRHLPSSYRDRWSQFISDYRKTRPHLSTFVDSFIKARVNNKDDIVQHLQESGLYVDEHAGRSIVTTSMLPPDLPATYFGHFMTEAMEQQIKTVMNGLEIKTGRWFPPVIDESLSIKPTYFPIDGRPISVPTFCTFLTGFETLSTPAINFRFALWMVRYAPKLQDPVLRDAIYNSAIGHINAHISTCLPWLMDPDYRQKEGMDYVPPWFDLSALHMLLMGCQVAGQPEYVTQRVRRLISMRQYLTRGSETVTVEGRTAPVVNKDMVRLVQCPGGFLMPETLCDGSSCVYCNGRHPDGLNYHQDGTTPLVAHRVADDGTPLLSWRERCRYCLCYYAIVDQRLGDTVRRCFNCRTGKELGLTSPVVVCAGCGDRWVMSSERPADWRCAGCLYSISVTTPTYQRTTIHELARSNTRVRDELLQVFPELPLVTFSAPFKAKFADATAPELLHWRPPGAAAATAESPAGPDPINIDTIIYTIRSYQQDQSCCIGQCTGRPTLFSPCGECTMMACRECLHRMMTFAKGSTVPRSAVLCFCRRPVSHITLLQIGMGKARVPQLLNAMGDDGCVHVCLNDGDRARCQRYVPGRLVADCAAAALDPAAEPAPPSDDLNYRCQSCLQTHLTHHTETRSDNKEEMINSLSAIAAPGTILRMCPGTCGTYQMRTDENYCAHMSCPACKIHWCWICRACFSERDECYDHMNNMNDSEESFHLERVWAIGPDDPVDPHESDVVVSHS